MYLYFSLNEVPNISPAFSGMWSASSQATRRVLKPKTNTDTITVGSTIDVGASAGSIALDRQYISPGLAFDQIISGKISGQLMARELVNNDNVDRVILCGKVVTSAGAIRGTIISSGNYGPTLELLNNGMRNKTIASGQSINLLTGFKGDRLVFEIGYQTSVGGTSPQGAANWGSNAPLLPVNETQLTDGAGWISITPDLKFNSTIFINQISSD